MHTMFYAFARMIAHNPWVAMISGIFVASIGALDIWATEKDVVNIAFSGETGLVLAGLQQAAFGLTNLVMGTRLVGIGILGGGHDDHHPVFQRMLKGLVENPFIVFGLGFMLIAMVSVHAWQEWIVGVPGQSPSVWYFGLALMGLLAAARSAENLLLALGMMAEGESRGHFVLRLANAANRHMRKPWLLVTVAAMCIALGMAEEIFVVAQDAATPSFIAHYGFLLFAVMEAGKLMPIAFFGSLLAEEGLAPPQEAGQQAQTKETA